MSALAWLILAVIALVCAYLIASEIVRDLVGRAVLANRLADAQARAEHQEHA